ncbi:MAG: hypothetical protein BWK79_19850 [Beggiatoa sp. IS2]|nr:MAG: hypothetical protein BWK79_19850 [Beggiatoa sp. IS2]
MIEPFLVRRIENTEGQVIYSAKPLQVCQSCTPLNETAEPKQLGDQCLGSDNSERSGFLDADTTRYGTHAFSGQKTSLAPRVISYKNAFDMTSILKDVIQKGTAQKARVLKRNDIAGKTGTTQEARDAWFIGYTPDIVTATWVGFDKPRSLGTGETGGRAALPMWIDFMQAALKGKPEKILDPAGDFKTRLIADAGTKANIYGTKPSSYSTPVTPRSQSQSARRQLVGRQSVRRQLEGRQSVSRQSVRRQPVGRQPVDRQSTRQQARNSPTRESYRKPKPSSVGSKSSGSSTKRQTTSSSPPSKRIVPVQLF